MLCLERGGRPLEQEAEQHLQDEVLVIITRNLCCDVISRGLPGSWVAQEQRFWFLQIPCPIVEVVT